MKLEELFAKHSVLRRSNHKKQIDPRNNISFYFYTVNMPAKPGPVPCPSDAYMEKLDAKVKAVGAQGITVITWPKPAKDAQAKKTPALTKEQMEKMRVLIVNGRRDDYLKKAGKMVNCGQKGSCMMFNTHSGNKVVLGILRMAKAAQRKKMLPDKFDALFGLTFQIFENDFWVSDNEMSGPDGKRTHACAYLLVTYSISKIKK